MATAMALNGNPFAGRSSAAYVEKRGAGDSRCSSTSVRHAGGALAFMRRRTLSRASFDLPCSSAGRAAGFISAAVAASGSTDGASAFGGALGVVVSPAHDCCGTRSTGGATGSSCRAASGGGATGLSQAGAAGAGFSKAGASGTGFSSAGAAAAALPNEAGATATGLTGAGCGPKRSSAAVSSSNISAGGRPCAVWKPGVCDVETGVSGFSAGMLLAADGASLCGLPASAIRPRAARSVLSTCFRTIGFWITKFSPARGPPRLALCGPTIAMVTDFLLAVAMRALCSTQPAPCSSSQSTRMASKCWSINRLAAAKGSLQGSTEMSRSFSNRARVWTRSASLESSSDLKAMTKFNLGPLYRPNK